MTVGLTGDVVTKLGLFREVCVIDFCFVSFWDWGCGSDVGGRGGVGVMILVGVVILIGVVDVMFGKRGLGLEITITWIGL
jgi:hypothetical protein